ncbi:hypothetical protein FACS1894211_00780 [Clostridia bacterium]|nr:hypothetical protein FACS1894211_00780 [Clostridia bacterium]
MELKVLHTEELDGWIAERHYLKSAPAISVIRLEFTEAGKRIGAMLWGRPTSPRVDQKHTLELTRMYFIDDTERFAESKALAMARKHIRKRLPHIRGLIAYCSTGAGHKGTVYEADGWFKLSESRSQTGSWENRPNRKNRDLSVKLKFGRSP